MRYDRYLDLFAQYESKDRDEMRTNVISQEGIDNWTKLRLLPLALDKTKDKGFKEYVRKYYQNSVHTKNRPSPFKKLVIEPHRLLMKSLGLDSQVPEDLSSLPQGTTYLSFDFILKKPYISRDDAVFHILDNPVRKEKVFKLPMVSASSWKGNLRWMANFQAHENWLREKEKDESLGCEHRLYLWRLFGPEKDTVTKYFNKQIAVMQNHTLNNKKEINEKRRNLEDAAKKVGKSFETYMKRQGLNMGEDQGLAGRLHFYPTFFDNIGLEVINPQDGETDTGKLPIYFEAVPAGARGVFSLLYVPFDLMGESDKEKQALAVQTDLKLVTNALEALLMEYGFSAKKSSGFGVIGRIEAARLQIKGLRLASSQSKKDLLDLPFADFSALRALLEDVGGTL